jgi:spermidine synthase
VNRLVNLLTGSQILEEVDSEFNGKLTVMRDIAWGTYIQAGGITQSGGVAKTVWKTVLTRVVKEKFNVKKALIIGLGGGGLSGIIQRNWPGVGVTGVDIDPVIVEMGKKYLGLSEDETKIVIGDGLKFIKKDKNKYDLICVDTYHGQDFPEKFETMGFIKEVKKHLEKGGAAVFNRLYFGKKRILAEKFEKTLGKEFSQITRVYPEANLMFVCRV